ncbi:hypothetical protein V1517DRAFT_324879 [Lipomyces orientalis]|uniref:Uncharacterized protein n=1 Tax=Lipomyces orientalis TaxID=1233043 RepID=A0ACC3TM72_9ASCO
MTGNLKSTSPSRRDRDRELASRIHASRRQNAACSYLVLASVSLVYMLKYLHLSPVDPSIFPLASVATLFYYIFTDAMASTNIRFLVHRNSSSTYRGCRRIGPKMARTKPLGQFPATSSQEGKGVPVARGE